MQFDQLGLRPEILQAVASKNYTSPTPIQAKAIPAVLTGRDILAGAQTGTGKTAAFTLPLLQLLAAKNPNCINPRALVLTPTRELAAQVGDSIKTYGKNLKLKSAVIFGGVGINPQIKELKNGIDILVATPGRLLDHVSQGNTSLKNIEILVLDEADRMLDMGFIHDIKKVLRLLPPNRQNLLFSATYSHEIKTLADSLLNKPELIEVARQNTTAETISQIVYHLDKTQKRAALSYLIKQGNWHQVLVFTRTKHGANRLAKQLNDDQISADAIHGNKSQSARTRALAGFKSGEIRVLVATDIAARGLDIDKLPHVVNYELPNIPEDYVHRIGRTGRAGSNGVAMSLVSDDERAYLASIQRLVKQQITVETLPNFTPTNSDLNEAAKDVVMERQQLQRRQNSYAKKRSANNNKEQNSNRSANNKEQNSSRSANNKYQTASSNRSANSKPQSSSSNRSANGKPQTSSSNRSANGKPQSSSSNRSANSYKSSRNSSTKKY